MKKRVFLCLAAVMSIWWTGIGIAQQSKVPAEVWQKAQTEGIVRVLVGVDAPTKLEGRVSPEVLQAHQQVIAAAQDELLAELAGTNHRVTQRYSNIPGLALEVGPDALAALERSPRVTDVREVRILKPHQEQRVPKEKP
mgnify:CR=1 FL=1